ncbi:hypothetical protein TorRG33x02_076120 [Trema orientale]|uniref:Endonuclease/exonuclease/phosphatase n=1 Tax=Trema orientale TaxID=63057 RepID=A0A2P5FFS2_TREOI|nr:hypothetical protein TorRG33x02_076120 [Trema orientale]
MSLHFLGVWRETSILCSSCTKKRCGRDFDFNGMRDFQNAASDCLLADLGYVSEMMTWNNGYEEDTITERRDRVLYNGFWGSDHLDLHPVLDTTLIRNQVSRRSRCLLFELWWLKDKKCREIIKRVWEREPAIDVDNLFMRKLEKCSRVSYQMGFGENTESSQRKSKLSVEKLNP